jgi:hypothetical protein
MLASWVLVPPLRTFAGFLLPNSVARNTIERNGSLFSPYRYLSSLRTPPYSTVETQSLEEDKPSESSTIPNEIQEIKIQGLATLLKRGSLDEAFKLLETLRKERVQIPPDALYVDAALLMLKRPRYLARNPSVFANWLKLAPHAQNSHQETFDEMITFLSKGMDATKREHIFLLARLCASKGYFYALTEKVMPLLSRYMASDSERKEFIRELTTIVIAKQPSPETIRKLQGGLDRLRDCKYSA